MCNNKYPSPQSNNNKSIKCHTHSRHPLFSLLFIDILLHDWECSYQNSNNRKNTGPNAGCSQKITMILLLLLYRYVIPIVCVPYPTNENKTIRNHHSETSNVESGRRE